VDLDINIVAFDQDGEVLAKINFQNKEAPGLHLGKTDNTDGDAAADEKKPLGFEVGRCRLTLSNPR
jgi:hypothetical protein